MFFLFGMNIENDYHILRNLMLELYFANVEDPTIIYTFYNEDQKKVFVEQYQKLITFDKEASNYASSIKILFVSTKDILAKVFYK